MIRALFISGQQGAGKTTIASFVASLAKADGFVPVTLKFADPLYEMHEAIMEIMSSYGIRRPDQNPHRVLLQMLGTDYGRVHLGESVWIDAFARRARTLLDSPKVIVLCDDVRFPNELVYAKATGGVTVRLSAPETQRALRAKKWGGTSHPSETSLTGVHDFDLHFDTSSTPPDEVSGKIWTWMKSH